MLSPFTNVRNVVIYNHVGLTMSVLACIRRSQSCLPYKGQLRNKTIIGQFHLGFPREIPSLFLVTCKIDRLSIIMIILLCMQFSYGLQVAATYQHSHPCLWHKLCLQVAIARALHNSVLVNIVALQQQYMCSQLSAPAADCVLL